MSEWDGEEVSARAADPTHDAHKPRTKVEEKKSGILIPIVRTARTRKGGIFSPLIFLSISIFIHIYIYMYKAVSTHHHVGGSIMSTIKKSVRIDTVEKL